MNPSFNNFEFLIYVLCKIVAVYSFPSRVFDLNMFDADHLIILTLLTMKLNAGRFLVLRYFFLVMKRCSKFSFMCRVQCVYRILHRSPISLHISYILGVLIVNPKVFNFSHFPLV